MLPNLLQPLAGHGDKAASVSIKIHRIFSSNLEILALGFGFLCILIAAAIVWRIEKHQSRTKVVRDCYHYPCEMDATCLSASQHYDPSLEPTAHFLAHYGQY